MTPQERLKNFKNGTHTFTDEERSKGGQNAKKTKAEKKSMRELAELINNLPENGKIAASIKAKHTGITEDVTMQMAFMFRVFQEAMAGNVKAMKLWTEMSDELANKKKEMEIEKLKAEIETLRGGGHDKEVPTFNFNFSDFSMDDEGGAK